MSKLKEVTVPPNQFLELFIKCNVLRVATIDYPVKLTLENQHQLGLSKVWLFASLPLLSRVKRGVARQLLGR